jgi:hypothetical protein
MENINLEPNSYRFLLCRDIDAQSALKIAEHFVPLSPIFDGIILCGPFIHDDLTSPESEAVAVGDIASIIAQFENIVCRVIYLPGPQDPHETLTHQLHLTPNSVNIHGRQLNLTNSLSVVGFTEKNDSAVSVDNKSNQDEDEEDSENIDVKSGLSISIVQELLQNATQQSPTIASRIFALNYTYSHTLNQFLFHLPTELAEASVGLCIIASDNKEMSRLPAKFGGLSIAALKSLRKEGYYTIVEMTRDDSTRKWAVTNNETHSLKAEA